MSALAELVRMVFEIYSIILLVRVLISWVNPDPFNPSMIWTCPSLARS